MLCCNFNIVSVIVELDARTIVDAISNDQYVNNVISPILDDCRWLISRFHRILFKHCYWEANHYADSLARMSINQEIDFVSYESPPMNALKAYKDDRNGFYLSRLCPVPFVVFLVVNEIVFYQKIYIYIYITFSAKKQNKHLII